MVPALLLKPIARMHLKYKTPQAFVLLVIIMLDILLLQ